MTQILKCVIEDRFCVTGVARGNPKASRDAKPSEISLELRLTESDQVLVSKTLPWPTGEELPSQISYDKKAEVLLIKNRTTQARVPFRSRVLKALEEQHRKSEEAPRIVSSLDEDGSNDTKSNEYAKLLSAIRAVIEDPSDARWKKLRTALSSSGQLELGAMLTHNEQSALLQVVKDKTALADKDAQTVLKGLVSRDVFSYKMLEEVHQLCESCSFDSVTDELVLSNQSALPEKTFVKCLKKAASAAASGNDAYLKKLLDLPFEDKRTAAAASVELTSGEAAGLVARLIEMYKDERENERHGKVLSLISLLFDSHSTQFLNDAETHEAILEAASFIASMTSLTGSFAELECTRAARKQIVHGEAAKPEFEVKTVQLKVRKWVQREAREDTREVTMNGAMSEEDSD